MQLILFTKMLRGASVEEVGKQARALEFAGLDLAVRDGHCCNAENITEVLPAAVATWKRMNLSVPMVSLEPTPNDPNSPATRRIFAACAKAGIPNIKLGYWHWPHNEDYWKKFDQIRRDLDAFQSLGKEYGVCSLLHTHSDVYYASNASGAMHLARGFDRKYIGIYLDPAHLSVDGEPFPMALAMAKDYLKAIGVKSITLVRTNNPDSPRFGHHGGLLSDGYVEWPKVIAELKAQGKDVPLSFHAEYSQQGTLAELLPLVKADLEHLKSIL